MLSTKYRCFLPGTDALFQVQMLSELKMKTFDAVESTLCVFAHNQYLHAVS